MKGLWNTYKIVLRSEHKFFLLDCVKISTIAHKSCHVAVRLRLTLKTLTLTIRPLLVILIGYIIIRIGVRVSGHNINIFLWFALGLESYLVMSLY